ncbi:unnamed protein product, partial [Discosporangium mesarthrocarpum]
MTARRRVKQAEKFCKAWKARVELDLSKAARGTGSVAGREGGVRRPRDHASARHQRLKRRGTERSAAAEVADGPPQSPALNVDVVGREHVLAVVHLMVDDCENAFVVMDCLRGLQSVATFGANREGNSGTSFADPHALFTSPTVDGSCSNGGCPGGQTAGLMGDESGVELCVRLG